MNDYINNWDEFWMLMARTVSQKSKDPSVKLGVIIVSPANDFISMGYNGFPRGVKEVGDVDCRDESGSAVAGTYGLIEDRWEKRPEKYRWVEHAARNAVYNAARLGRATLGAKAYINAHPIPCADCTRSFIQAGITEIIGLPDRFRGKGVGTHYHCGDIEVQMLKEAGVDRRILDI